MANFTQNITNAVRCFGNGPPTKWGQSNGITYTMVWGVANWGEGFAVITRSDWRANISNSVGSDFNYYRSDVRHRFDNQIDVTSEPGRENLMDGSGRWSYVFVSDTKNGEDRDFATWTENSSAQASFTCQAAASTSWS